MVLLEDYMNSHWQRRGIYRVQSSRSLEMPSGWSFSMSRHELEIWHPSIGQWSSSLEFLSGCSFSPSRHTKWEKFKSQDTFSLDIVNSQGLEVLFGALIKACSNLLFSDFFKSLKALMSFSMNSWIKWNCFC